MKDLSTTTTTPPATADKLARRVSFNSPNKTIDTTPPSSRNEDDDDFLASQAKPRKEESAKLRVNKVLCRVPSYESNISDLSASLSPHISKAKPSEEESPLMAMLNVCGINEISDLIPSNILSAGSEGKKKRVERPAEWGVPPSKNSDDESDDEDEDEDEKRREREQQKRKQEEKKQREKEQKMLETSVEYDNVELMLDESAVPPPAAPSNRSFPLSSGVALKKTFSDIVRTGRHPGRPSHLSGGVTLKKTLSGIVRPGKYTPQPTEEVGPNIIINPEEVKKEAYNTNHDHISHIYDKASFQNEMRRPTPVDLVDDEDLVAASFAAAKAVASRRSRSVDSFAGKMNPPVEGDNEGEVKTSEKKKRSKSSEPSEAFAVSEKPSEPAEEKAGSKETKKEPSRKFMKGLSLKKNKSADPQKEVEQTEVTQETKDNSETTKKYPAKKSTSSTTQSNNVEPSARPTDETIDDAKHWKSAVDPSTSKTYYYHSQTKITTWKKPKGFDEAQKLKRLWKATVDQNTGKTYYYNSKTKEVRWDKPEGFVERKKKGKRVPNKKDDKKADQEPKNTEDVADEATFENKEKETVDKQPQAIVRAPSDEDAPFDEPPPVRAEQDVSPQNTDDDAFESDGFNETDMWKPIELSTRTKTFASHMTDMTPRFNNTSATGRTRDFTDAQIDVNVMTDTREKRVVPKEDEKRRGSDIDAAANQGAVAVPTIDSFNEEESGVFDDYWGDEVSELSDLMSKDQYSRKNIKNRADTRVVRHGY